MQHHEYTTQNSLKFLITLGNWFLLMPVSNDEKEGYKFRWSTCKTIAALIATIISLIEFILFFIYFFDGDRKFVLTSSLVYFLTILLYKMLFIEIARKWPELMKRWCEIDFSMQNYVVVEDYKYKINLVLVLFFTFAIGEHLFFLTLFSDVFLEDAPVMDKLQAYFHMNFRFVFASLPYSLYLGIFVQILNILWTIIWNYVDVFLISLFITFSFRLKQIESKIALMIKYKIQNISYWKQAREHFVKLTELCYKLETCLSPLILISFANKLYVILYQLLGVLSGGRYGIENSDKAISRLYYAFSFGYILLRLAAVIYYASVIDMKNNDILWNLFSASSEVYNKEIDIFITSLKANPPAISGAKLFEIKKSLMLKIVSSIIIYELVIIEFHKSNTFIKT